MGHSRIGVDGLDRLSSDRPATPRDTGVMVNFVAQGRVVRRIGGKRALLIAAALLVVAGLGYLARYGDCNVHSQYCVVAVAGTRSEVGFTWDTWDFYISTSPSPDAPVLV
jgi:hypothetical protein